MPPIKSDDDEHKKCLNDKIKSESALSKSKPLWISSNMKTTKSDESISKTELPKSSCANSKTTRCSLDKSVRDQYKRPARIEEEPETFTEIQSNQNNIRKVSRSPQNFKSNNTTAANPGAWQFWMIYPKEPHPIKTLNENPISKIVAPKSTDDSSGKKPNKADTKTSSAKTPVHQNDLGAPNPKQAVTSKSSTPIKTNTSQTAPTSEAASDKTKPMPVPKQPLAQKPKQQNKPMGQIKPSEFLAKDVKSGKAEQINLKPIQQIGKADSNTLGSSGKATDFVGDKKIPPLKTDSQKPKAQNPILATLFKHFDGTTERGKANTMAGDSPVDESQLKGLSKYFNGQTNRGRANVAKATYAVIGVVILYFSVRPSKK